MQTSTTPMKDRAGLGARIDKELKRQVAHKLIDAGMTMNAWLESVMRDFVAQGAQKSRVHTVLPDLAEK